MDSAVLTTVLAAYEARRRKNREEEDRRLREIEAKHPEIVALMQARHDLVMSAVRGAVSGASADPEKTMADYNAKIAAALTSARYPPDYLSPIFDCPLCQDTGYVYDHSIKKPCECLNRACAAAARSQERDASGQTFAAFDLNRFPADPLPGTDVTQRQYMAMIRDKALAFVHQIPDGQVKTLLLHGPSGLGKTYLLHCVENSARQRGLDALYVTAYDLLMALRAAYFSRDDEARPYFDAPLLLIDDLGMEPLMENITVEQIYHLLNARVGHGLATAISTNLSRTELQRRYTERVTSRLFDVNAALALPFLGKDIRLLKTKDA